MFEFINQQIDSLSSAVTQAAGVKTNVAALKSQVNALHPPPPSPMATLYNDVASSPKNQTLLMVAVLLGVVLVVKRVLKK